MGKIGAYQRTEKYKNYSLPTSKPLRSHAFYKEKTWVLQDQIDKKLNTVAEFLDGLHPRLTDDFSGNVLVVVEKNLEKLMNDLDLLQSGFHKNPDSFNTNKLKTNQRYITEMKDICTTLQTVRSYEHNFKKLGKIKHALHELEHLIQPTKFEKSLEKTQVKSKPKKVSAKKEKISIEPKKKIKEKPIVNAKKQKTISKKAKPTTKLLKPKSAKLDSKQPQKTKKAIPKLKQSAKKVTKPKSKPKLAAKHKNVLRAKPKLKAKAKPKIKSSATPKKKLSH